jgi:hypothetical protein
MPLCWRGKSEIGKESRSLLGDRKYPPVKAPSELRLAVLAIPPAVGVMVLLEGSLSFAGS